MGDTVKLASDKSRRSRATRFTGGHIVAGGGDSRATMICGQP
jgi:hypothetical protein